MVYELEMAHKLEMTENGASMAYVGQKPWHGLGVELPEGVTPNEMMVAAGLDWKVTQVPTYIEIDDKKIYTNTRALVRDSDNEILDVVSDEWNTTQNHEAFEFFDRFAKEGNLKMETAGSLKGGQLVWALAKMDKTFEPVANDPTNNYILFTNPHTYGRSIDVRLTPVRVVCNNTLTMALRDGMSTTSVRQSHRSVFDADFVASALGLAAKKIDTFAETLTFLASKRADPTQIEFYMKEVFPHYNEDKQDTMSRTATKIMANFETQAGAEFGEGSWYQVFNAVTFGTNHVLGRSNESRLRSNWYGINAGRNARALDAAVKYAVEA